MKLMKCQQKSMIDELISSLEEEEYEQLRQANNQTSYWRIYDNFEKKIKILKNLKDML